MNPWIWFLIVLFVLAYFIVCQYFSYHDGLIRGKEEGYRLGRIDSDNWWLEAEKQVDQARQKIWREEGSKR